MDEIKLLQNFVCDVNLEKLEDKYLSDFNLFNAIGMNSQEIKHSNFLAWMFNPNEKHTLGDFFVKTFLKEVLRQNSDSFKDANIPSVFDIDCWDMSELVVKRENCNIDILFIDKKNSFVCIIENKIKSYQGRNQLTNYKEKISKLYSDYKYKLFLYLKPVLDEDIDASYIYVSYEIIKNIINKILQTRDTYLSQDIQLVLSHYKDLLERSFMGSKELQEICKQIYAQHKEAINLIINNVDTTPAQTQIAEALVPILEKYGFIRVKGNGNRNIKFLPKEAKNTNDFCFKIWNTGEASEKNQALKLELSPEKSFDQDKLNEIRVCLSISGKKIGNIVDKNSIINICENIEENGCMTNEQEESLKNGLSKILEKIDTKKIVNILNS